MSRVGSQHRGKKTDLNNSYTIQAKSTEVSYQRLHFKNNRRISR